MSKVYDVVIIGAGPAGCTAALYCARAGFTTMVIEKTTAGGQMCLAHSIENYPGFECGIDGFELGEKMKKTAENQGAKIVSGEICEVDLKGEIKKVKTKDDVFRTKTVVVATGAEHKQLGIEQEQQLTGKGVCYCATCDGMFYKNKTAAVVGGGNSAVSDAIYLSKICRKVYIVHRRDSLRASNAYNKQLENIKNIEILWNSKVNKLLFDDKLKGIELCSADGVCELYCDGLFISIGRKPETEMFKNQLTLDDYGYVISDETTKTNLEGVFAVGDVRTKPLRQIVTATADGAVAAHFIEEYLLC